MKLNVLLEKPKTKILAIIFLVFFALTLILLGVVFPIALAQFPPGAGLMDIKNAWNKQNMDAIVAIWNADPSKDYVGMMVFVHMVDLVFMAIYGIAVFSGLLLSARLLKDSEKLQKFYLYASFVAWVAVAFDLVEEYHILVMLADISNVMDINAFGASLSTNICMIFLYGGILLFVIGFIIALIQHLKNK